MKKKYMTKTKTFFKPKVFGMPKPVWTLIRWVFVLSGAALTLTATLRGSALAGLAGVAVSAVVCGWLVFRTKILEETVRGFSVLNGLIALPYAAAAARIFMAYFYFRFEKLSDTAFVFLSARSGAGAELFIRMLPGLKTALTVFIGLALWLAAYWMIGGIRRRGLPFLRGLNGTEIAFILAGAAVSMALIFIVYTRTNLFYLPLQDGQIVNYDAVFTADSGVLTQTNVFVNINAAENDLRHPLFGLFAMPLGITASWIAFLFKSQPLAYPLALAFLQALALLFSMIMVSRLAGAGHVDQIFFLLLYFISYPSLLFILTVEQYIVALFWLSLCLYFLCRPGPDGDGWREISYSGAAGTLLTSGFFILFSPGGKGLKGYALSVLRSGLGFLAFAAVFGQLPQFVNAVQTVKNLSRFAGYGLPFGEKLCQYLTFIPACLIAPAAGISRAGAYISYQMLPVEDPGWIGVILLALASAGFLLNLRSKFCRVCFSWLLFSFCLLALAGWGSLENGMILYTLYFSWALLSLIYAGLQKALAKHTAVRLSLVSLGLLAVAAFNIRGLRELIGFGISYYPR